MARLPFPADRTAYVYTALGDPIRIPVHAGMEVFLDEACTLQADIRTMGGALIINSTIYTDDAGLIPEFLGPNNASGPITRLWARPIGGAPYPLDAQFGPRIDALAAAIPIGGGGGTTASANTILSTDTDPSPLDGADGDYIINYVTHVIYGPKLNGAWGPGTSLVGPEGPAGPAGTGGTSVSQVSYTHSQFSASDVWDITHPLAYVPSVSVVDSAGSVVQGDVSVISTGHLQVHFSAPFSGSAFLS